MLDADAHGKGFCFHREAERFQHAEAVPCAVTDGKDHRARRDLSADRALAVEDAHGVAVKTVTAGVAKLVTVVIDVVACRLDNLGLCRRAS